MPLSKPATPSAGIFEVVAHQVPVGLGSHAQWDEKLDGNSHKLS